MKLKSELFAHAGEVGFAVLGYALGLVFRPVFPIPYLKAAFILVTVLIGAFALAVGRCYIIRKIHPVEHK